MKKLENIRFLIIIISILFTIIFTMIILLPNESMIDSDNDGIMNDKDLFPYNKFESKDSDDDGIGDNSDKFIYDPSASKDSDDDGYPDRWNTGKSQLDSTSIPKLSIDHFPYDPNEHNDTDGDGIGDNSDVFPNDSSESFDDDGDGIGNNKDKNPNVNLGFSLYLDKFKISKFVDFLPHAQIYFVIKINGEVFTILDNKGSFWKVWIFEEESIGFNFDYDIDDSTNMDNTSIEIIMYEKDFIFKDDIIDINPDISETNLKIVINHKKNLVDVNSISEGKKGKVWFNVILPDEIEPIINYRTMIYNWSFLGRNHQVILNIPLEKYNWYLQREVNRTPQHISTSKMALFITDKDEIIQGLSTKLLDISNQYNYNKSNTVNFILSFIQECIEYEEDIDSKGLEEYWKYPIETLIERNGDCEDSSILFQSIIKNTGYEVIMLFYIIDDNIGHLASGVYIGENISGHSVKHNDKIFYYCETTSVGYRIGEKPTDIPNKPKLIISLAE
jgi:hypothetical protein